jgi:hypothetical protein
MPSPTYFPLGVRYDGRYAAHPVTPVELANMAQREEETPLPGATSLSRRLVNSILDYLKVNRLGEFSFADPDLLADPGVSGWGVVYHESTPAGVREEVERLKQHRQGQQLQDWGRGDTLSSWLEKYGIDSLHRDVPSTLPYYILIVGKPQHIPFQEQFELSRLGPVGRLDFGDNPLLTRDYIDGLIEQEQKAAVNRKVLLASARNPGDEATGLCSEVLIPYLADLLEADAQISGRGFSVEKFTQADCDRVGLANSPGEGNLSPVMQLLAGHGLCFPINDARQAVEQGSWIGSDWRGGPVQSRMILAADEVGRAFQAAGSIVISLASYSSGTPQKSEFAQYYNVFHPNRKIEVELAQVSFTASFPKRLLANRQDSRPAGTLAFVGLTDLFWPGAFCDVDREKESSPVLGELLRGVLLGEPAGLALHRFTGIIQACNADLAGYKNKLGKLKMEYAEKIGSLWLMRMQARGMVLIGDPVVKIRSSRESL